MTTLNPIDLDKDSADCVALIDLENIRLSWQRYYERVFEYADLVLLCQLSERLMNTTMSRIIIFATNPEEFELQSVKTAAIRAGILQPTCNLNSNEVRRAKAELERRSIPLNEDVAAGYRLIERIQLDAKRSTARSNGVVPRFVGGADSLHSAVKRRRLLSGDTSSDNHHVPPAPPVSHSPERRIETADGLSDMSELSSSPGSSPRSSIASSSEENNCHTYTSDGDDLDEIRTLSSNVSEDVVVLSTARESQADSDDDVVVLGDSRAPSTIPSNVGSVTKLNILHDLNRYKVESGMSLTGTSCDRHVTLRLYGFKYQKGRAVQRGCDVALGAEITKACFHPNIDKIVLFSADSDFQELMEENIKAENIGGVVKFAKTSWIFGFRRAFSAKHARPGLTAKQTQERGKGNGNRFNPGLFQRDNITYVILDVQFPQIKQYLQHSRAKRKACSRPFVPMRRPSAPPRPRIDAH